MGPETNSQSGRLRIGELADAAGTTTRAIRHYHAIGLMAEPERDGSGYRRYGAADLVRLVRIRRLRQLGLPLERIAASLDAQPRGDGLEADALPAALQALAAGIAEEIVRLRELHTRVLRLAAAEAQQTPVEAWGAALHRHGLLADAAALPAGEHAAVELLDALHPDGIGGVIANTTELMSDPARVDRLAALLHRFQTLPDDADDALVDALAAEYVAALPRPDRPSRPVDVETMEKLAGDRLSPAQRRCLRRTRELFAERES